MPLFCTSQGVINSDLTFIPSLEFNNLLVPLNYGVGALLGTEAVAFKFKDSDSGLIWNILTPDWIDGRMAYPIHIGDYIYYLSRYNGEAVSAELMRVLYSLGTFGVPEIISSSAYGEYNSFLYVNESFYLYSTEGHVTITSNFITFTEHDSTRSAYIYFKDKFHDIGTNHYSSVDGYTWIDEGALPIEVYWEAHNDDILIAMNDTQMVTYNGTSWSTVINLPIIISEVYPIPWLDIAYNNGVFCIVGSNQETSVVRSIIGTSVDNGSSWQTQLFTDLTLDKVVPMYPAKFWEHFIKATES